MWQLPYTIQIGMIQVLLDVLQYSVEPASCEADDISLPRDISIIIQFLAFFVKFNQLLIY